MLLLNKQFLPNKLNKVNKKTESEQILKQSRSKEQFITWEVDEWKYHVYL